MTEESSLIRVERHGDVVVLALNRPEARNSLNLELVERFHALLGDLERDASLKAVVVQGVGGKAFAAGADIGDLLRRTHKEALQGINARLFERIENLPVPTIAAICGVALGGGCELALACDMRISGRSAKFGQPEVTLGIVPAAGATYRLPRLVGQGLARELIYTGRIIGADEALSMGLVNRVVDDEEVEKSALALGAEIAKNATLAVRLSKTLLNASARGAHPVEIESITQGILFDSEEKRARMQAFLDRKSK